MTTLVIIFFIAFLIFVCKISFSTIFGILYLFLTLGFTFSCLSSLRKGNIGSAIKTGIPAIIFILILFKAIF